MEKMKNRNIVKKRNVLIKGKYNLSLNEQKLILLSISQIDKNDLKSDTKKYYIDLEKIDKKLSKQNRTRIKDFSMEILKKPLYIEKEKGGFFVCNWFSDIEYLPNTQQLEVSFSSKLLPYIFELKENFTRYDLREVISFKSSYSIRFYELFKSYMNTRHKEFTLELEGEKGLFEMFQIPKSLQQKQKLEEKILKIVDKDINKNSNIKFTYSLIKSGRKFTHITFKLSHNYEVIEKRKEEQGTQYWEEMIKEVLNNTYFDEDLQCLKEKKHISNDIIDYRFTNYIDLFFLYKKFEFENDIFYLKSYELKNETYFLTLEDIHEKGRGLGKVNTNCKDLISLYHFLKVRFTEETELETNLFSQSKIEGK